MARKTSEGTVIVDRINSDAVDTPTLIDAAFTDEAEAQIREAEAEADHRVFITDAEVAKLRARFKR